MYTSSNSNPHRILSPLRLFALIGFLLLGSNSCGDDDPAGSGHNYANLIQNNIVFMREDSTTLVMGSDYAICCAIWEPGYIDKNALKIVFYDPRLWSDPDNAESFWKLFIVVDEVDLGTPYSLPTSADMPFRIFFMDVTNDNELSGAEEESSGIVTIESLTCGPPLQITFSIDAIIGSEFHLMPTVHVTGTFSATVYANPSPLGCDFSM